MDLLTQIKGLHAVGWRNVGQAVIYGLKKTFWDAKRLQTLNAAPHRWQEIGAFQQVEEVPGGIRLDFEHASLEAVVLATDLVRLTWTPGVLPVPYALARTDWPEAEFTCESGENVEILSTSELVVRLEHDGNVTFETPEGAVLRRESPPLRVGDGWRHRAALREEERVFGLGQRNHALNLRGGRYLMWNEEPMGDYGPGKDPIYVCIPTYLGLHKQGNYLVFFENSHKATFDFERDATAEFTGGALRSYFIPGPMSRAMERYGELTGNAPLPPIWALHYHQCRWSYKTEEEVLELVEEFERRKLPLGTVHLDIHYMDGYRVFTVDRSRFPDLSRLCATLHEKGVKVVTILDPGVKKDPNFALYREGLEANHFCKSPDGDVIHGPVWPGWCGFPDFTDPEVRRWWGEQYKSLVKQGVDGFWHDMNEPAVFSGTNRPTLPLDTVHHMEGRGGDHLEAHNLYGLLENRAAFEALERLQPEKRPWILTRSGWAGVQRYAWNWTGDTGCNWWSLGHNLRLALMLGLSGVPYTGSDTGGFNGDPSPELFVRWFEMSSHMPFFRTHSAVFTKRREPWSFGEEVTEITRKFLDCRVKLLPYWYTLAWEASRTGRPLVRPLWWSQPENEALWDVDDAFMVGDSLLVAPVLEEGARGREVTFPDGDWMSLEDETWMEGSCKRYVKADLNHLPRFVRAGSLLPLHEGENLCLHAYLRPDTPSFFFTLYSDQGDGGQEGRIDRFEGTPFEGGWEIRRSVEGKVPFPNETLEIAVHGISLGKIVADEREIPIENGRAKVGLFDVLRLEIS